MTIFKKALARLIGLIVKKAFPKSAFFGGKYLSIFSDFDKSKGVLGYSAAMYLSRLARQSNADEVKITMFDVIDSGDAVGSWVVEVKRIDELEGEK